MTHHGKKQVFSRGFYGKKAVGRLPYQKTRDFIRKIAYVA